MPRKKRNHTAALKATVALAAIKEKLTQNQITSEYEVHSTQIKRWRDQAIKSINDGFSKKREKEKVDQTELIDNLYGEIGRLQTQLNWMKKKCGVDD